MIIREQENNDSWVNRLFRYRTADTLTPSALQILDRETFGLLVRKEIARCERRPRLREFAIVVLDMPESPPDQRRVLPFFTALRNRLRITEGGTLWPPSTTRRATRDTAISTSGKPTKISLT